MYIEFVMIIFRCIFFYRSGNDSLRLVIVIFMNSYYLFIKYNISQHSLRTVRHSSIESTLWWLNINSANTSYSEQRSFYCSTINYSSLVPGWFHWTSCGRLRGAAVMEFRERHGNFLVNKTVLPVMVWNVWNWLCLVDLSWWLKGWSTVLIAGYTTAGMYQCTYIYANTYVFMGLSIAVVHPQAHPHKQKLVVSLFHELLFRGWVSRFICGYVQLLLMMRLLRDNTGK